jgi:cytosine/adenosine deaminase-related metal-dependent hydrolase
MTTTLIRNVRPLRMSQTDLLIVDGVIQNIATGIEPPAGAEVIEGNGSLLFQGLIDGHTHMDKALIGLPWHSTKYSSNITETIANERQLRREEEIDAHQQSTRHAHAAIASGTTHIRSFADIDTEWGLKGVRGLMQTRDELKDKVQIQVVAFPQSGMLIRPGTVELLDQALSEGAEVIGGLDPSAIDRDPKGHLDTIFALAEKYDVDIDVHLHEPGDLGAFSFDLIIERTRVLGWQGRVTISHAFALGGIDQARLDGLVQDLLDLRIAIMSHGPSGGRPAPPVEALRKAGVRMISGNDGIQDSWGPLNRPEMLNRAYLVCYRNNFRRDDQIEDVIDIITNGSADVMGVDDYGFAVGKAADLALFDEENHCAAVVRRPTPWLVMKRGLVTARDSVVV